MSPVSLAMDGLLAVLLLVAVVVGVRLNGKLKVLRDSQGQFVRAVGDLDAAAGRAEAGLAALRSATEEAHDALLTRIETARALLPRLDRASEAASAASARLEEGVRAADAAGRRAQAAAQAAAQAVAVQAETTAHAAAVQAQAEAARPPARAWPQVSATDHPSQAGAEPIPFPAVARRVPERDLAAAIAAADRIVEAEAGRGPPELPMAPSASAAAVGGDRLARFVARRRSARA